MNALAILTAARDAGVKVTVDGTKIILEGDGLTDELVASFKANKPAILKLLESVPVVEEPTAEPTMAMDDPMNDARSMLCDDCGRPTVIALVTDYGCRYCRECVFPTVATTKKRGAA
jgi:hypothetical protein